MTPAEADTTLVVLIVAALFVAATVYYWVWGD